MSPAVVAEQVDPLYERLARIAETYRVRAPLPPPPDRGAQHDDAPSHGAYRDRAARRACRCPSQSKMHVFIMGELATKRDGSLLSLRTRLDFNEYYDRYNRQLLGVAADGAPP